MKKVHVLDAAVQDLQNGYDFYDKQVPGLGDYFLDTLFSDIDSLLIYAGVHPIFFNDYYRMLSKRFPYAIYYRISGDDLLIYAVLDCRKNPATLKQKIHGR